MQLQEQVGWFCMLCYGDGSGGKRGAPASQSLLPLSEHAEMVLEILRPIAKMFCGPLFILAVRGNQTLSTWFALNCIWHLLNTHPFLYSWAGPLNLTTGVCSSSATQLKSMIRGLSKAQCDHVGCVGLKAWEALCNPVKGCLPRLACWAHIKVGYICNKIILLMYISRKSPWRNR